MNEFKKYFPQGIDGLLDDAVKAVVKPLGDSFEFAEFLVFVMSMGMRRLKALFTPDEMSEEEKMLPAFAVEAIPSMTDEEIKAGFYPFSPMDKAKFVLAIRKADGPVALRFNVLLEQMKTSEQANRERNTAAIARRVQEEADRAREAAEEAEAKRVRTDNEALAYIAKAPEGRFQTVADLDAIVRKGENGDEVLDWVHRVMIPVGDAMVVGKCLITDKRTAERLAEKLRRPKDNDRPLAFTIQRTREWLAQCEKESEAALARRVKEERETMAARDTYMAEVRTAFAAAGTIPDKELARNRLKSECGGESWKLDIIRELASVREQELFERFRQELRERFPHSRCFPELDIFIKDTADKFLVRSKDEQWPKNAIDSAMRHVGIIGRHRQWLEENPAGVGQPRSEFGTDNVVPMRGHDRPKSGPGSGIGGQKRQLTPDQELARYGRQLLTSNWGRFSNLLPKAAKERGVKTVNDLTDEELIAVARAHRKPQKGDKAAKKQGGKKN